MAQAQENWRDELAVKGGDGGPPSKPYAWAKPGGRRPVWMKRVAACAVVAFVASAVVGAAGFWDDASWWVLAPAATFSAAVIALVGLWFVVPSGRWSVLSLHLGQDAVPGGIRTRRRLAFGTALCLVTLGLMGIGRGILGQWDAPIVVGFVLLGISGAILETIHRSAHVRERTTIP